MSFSPEGTLMSYVEICPTPRPTVLVIGVRNVPPLDGISVRRATGSDVVAPLLAVNCTDSGWSPGVPGVATSSGTVALECGAIRTGNSVAGALMKCCPEIWKEMSPVNVPGTFGNSWRWARPFAHKTLAVHQPGTGSATSTCWILGVVPFRPGRVDGVP